MARPDKKKVSTQGAVGEGLFQAFAGLSGENLPAGPETVETSQTFRCGRVVLRKETAHRGGKVVIVIHDFSAEHSDEQISALAKKLRAACGCGGAVKDRTIEIQGDIAPRLRELLEKEGYRVAGVK